MPHRRGCLTVATSSDSMAMQGQVLATTNESCFYREKQGIKALAAPFPCTPNPRRSSSASLRGNLRAFGWSLTKPNAFRHNQPASIASLRRLITPIRNADHDQLGTLITFIGIRTPGA